MVIIGSDKYYETRFPYSPIVFEGHEIITIYDDIDTAKISASFRTVNNVDSGQIDGNVLTVNEGFNIIRPDRKKPYIAQIVDMGNGNDVVVEIAYLNRRAFSIKDTFGMPGYESIIIKGDDTFINTERVKNSMLGDNCFGPQAIKIDTQGRMCVRPNSPLAPSTACNLDSQR